MAYIVFNLAGFVMEYQFQSKGLLVLASLSSLILRGGGFLAGIVSIIYGVVSILQMESLEWSQRIFPNGGKFVLLGIGIIIGAYLLALGITEVLWRIET